jgi:hypothetical protein
MLHGTANLIAAAYADANAELPENVIEKPMFWRVANNHLRHSSDKCPHQRVESAMAESDRSMLRDGIGINRPRLNAGARLVQRAAYIRLEVSTIESDWQIKRDQCLHDAGIVLETLRQERDDIASGTRLDGAAFNDRREKLVSPARGIWIDFAEAIGKVLRRNECGWKVRHSGFAQFAKRGIRRDEKFDLVFDVTGLVRRKGREPTIGTAWCRKPTSECGRRKLSAGGEDRNRRVVRDHKVWTCRLKDGPPRLELTAYDYGPVNLEITQDIGIASRGLGARRASGTRHSREYRCLKEAINRVDRPLYLVWPNGRDVDQKSVALQSGGEVQDPRIVTAATTGFPHEKCATRSGGTGQDSSPRAKYTINRHGNGAPSRKKGIVSNERVVEGCGLGDAGVATA